MITRNDFEDIFETLKVEKQKSWLENLTSNFFIPESKRFWSVYQTPFFKFILDFLDNPENEIISLICSSQIGKSIFLCGIAIEWALRYPGENVLFYCPDNSNAKMFLEKKLIPAILNSSNYSKHLPKTDNGEIDRKLFTKTLIKFVNGSTIEVLGIAGSNNTVSRTCSLVIADEFASAKTLRKNGGDLIPLLSRRLTSKAYNPNKMIIASTPLAPEKDIHKLWLESRQYQWGFKCPECGEDLTFDFKQLKWDHDSEMNKIELADKISSGEIEVYYECPHCKRKILESEKMELMSNGKPICVGNQDKSVNQVSLKVTGLYTTQKWSKYASDFCKTDGNIKNLMEFNTQVLCEPWNPFGGDKNIKKTSFKIGTHKKGIPPENTYKLIAGIDVQGNRYYYTVWAYTRDKKILLIDYGMPDFDLTRPFEVDSLPYELMSRSYGDFKISKAVMDVGFRQSVTIQICRQCGIIPVKGQEKARFANQYFYTIKDSEIKFCPLQESNELLDTLILNETIEFPQDINLNEEIIEHFLNVIKVKNAYKDKFDGARRDYRDTTRYALSYIISQNYHVDIQKAEYVAKNEEAIKQRVKKNHQILSNIFS